MKIFVYSLVGIVVSFVVFFSFYWLVKTGSYWLFYEDMVKSTIIEMVKQSALK